MASTTNTETTTTETTLPIVFGQCKWFNNKSGIGFISISSSGDLSAPDKDVFVHFSNINPKNPNSFKALQAGEYVQCNIVKCDEKNSIVVDTPKEGDTDKEDTSKVDTDKEDTCKADTDREQAINVCGINNGELLNEYRSSMRERSGLTPIVGKGSNGKGKGGFNRGGKGTFGKGYGRGGGGMRGVPPPHNPNQKEEWTPIK